MITIRTNLPEFNAQLDSLSAKVRGSLVRNSLAAAARVLRRQVAQTVPIGQTRKGHIAGTLKRSVYVGMTKLVNGGATAFVSAYTGKKYAKRNKDAYYAMWVEAGHAKRQPGPRGGRAMQALRRRRAASSGAMVPGRWYFKSAFRAAQNAAVDAFYARMSKGIAEGK